MQYFLINYCYCYYNNLLVYFLSVLEVKSIRGIGISLVPGGGEHLEQ